MSSVNLERRFAKGRSFFTNPQTRTLSRYLLSLLIVALATGLGLLVRPFLDPTNIAMIYLLAVVLSATTWGLGPSIFCSVAAVLSFDVIFVPPYGTFAVENTQYFLTFGIFLVVAVVISELGASVRSQVAVAEQREQQSTALYALTRGMALATDTKEILDTALKQVSEILDAETIILLPKSDKELEFPDDVLLGDAARRAAVWTFANGEASGYSTTQFPDSEFSFSALRTAQGTLGILGVRPHTTGLVFEPEQRSLIDALAGQIAIALEHMKLGAQAEQARVLEASDRFRTALLSSISHDLRTPLAAIMGSVTSLLDPKVQLTPARTDLLLTIEEEATRLNRLVGNLLNMTRLEAGALKPERDWHSIEEAIGAVLARVSTDKRDIQLSIAPDLPLAPFDFVLIEQVLLNLLDNAFKFSPPNSPIEISAHRKGLMLSVSIADRGSGIPLNDLEHVFEKFHRVSRNGVPGTGLGLSICKGIVEAHGGKIWAERCEGGGTRVTFTLPAPELEMQHE